MKKSEIERKVESLLWRIANWRNSHVVVAAALAGAFLLGMLAAWAGVTSCQ